MSAGGGHVDGGEGIAAVVVSYRSASTLDECLVRLRAATGG